MVIASMIIIFLVVAVVLALVAGYFLSKRGRDDGREALTSYLVYLAKKHQATLHTIVNAWQLIQLAIAHKTLGNDIWASAKSRADDLALISLELHEMTSLPIFGSEVPVDHTKLKEIHAHFQFMVDTKRDLNTTAAYIYQKIRNDHIFGRNSNLMAELVSVYIRGLHKPPR